MKKFFSIIIFIAVINISKLYTVEYIVVKGDCLWNIAKKYYSNPFLWKNIYEANKDKIKNPDLIYPGQVFVLPDITTEIIKEEKVVQETKTVEEQIISPEHTLQTEQKEITTQTELEVQTTTPQITTLQESSTVVEQQKKIELPKTINLQDFVSYGKIIGAKEKKFFYIDYDIVVCEIAEGKNLNINDIFGIYHLGPSKFDTTLMNVPQNQLTLVGKLKIIELKDDKTATAKILRIYSPVIIGDMISKIELK